LKLDIEFFLNCVYEVEKFFDMAYVPEEKHIKFETYMLKGGATAWWDPVTDHEEAPRQTTDDDMVAHETTPVR